MKALLNRLLGRRAPPAAPPQVPAGTRVYAVGDIHGRADLLDRLHARIAADAATAPVGCRLTLIYLGDYIDRGTESRGVLDRLVAGPPAGFDRVCLLGNHEQSALEFLDNPGIGPEWFQYGGAATLMSYGLASPLAATSSRLAAIRDEFQHRLPASHLAFLRSLPTLFISGDYLFVHAGIDPGKPIESQTATDLLWMREPFLSSTARLSHMVVHGHTVTRQPEVRVNRIGIDTGAFATGRLTALVLEGMDRRFLATA